MNDICPLNYCTACFACSNICPKKAIIFKENEYGVLYPKIKQELCINCDACKKVCPNNSLQSFKIPIDCYAAWRINKDKRKYSASGGIANVFSEYVVNYKHGSVWGIKSTNTFEVVFYEFTDTKTLEQSKGSQYVHSHIHNEFKKIKERLLQGKNVLFIGLPCQVAGLESFLGKEYENLLTCDLICHGVTPGRYLQEEINYIAKSKKVEVSACSFRNNAGSNFCFVLYDAQGKNCYKKQAYLNPYFNSFLQAITLRPNCNTCRYARSDRISDITIGDYIGLGQDAPFVYDNKNNSIVIINTKHGQVFWEEINNTGEIISIKRDYMKAVPFQPSLVKAFSAHCYTNKFLNYYTKFGFAKSIRKTLAFDIAVRKIKRLVYIILHIYKVPRKILRCLKK